MPNAHPRSIFAFLFCSLFLMGSTFFYPRWNARGSEATLSWDVAGYYLYLPAIFIYKDLKKVSFGEELIMRYQASGDYHQTFPWQNGNRVMKYSAGMAIIYLPFFLSGHAYAFMTNDYPMDGFSLPYQVAVFWGCLLFALWGLWLSRLTLLRHFQDATVAWVLVLIAAGTNFFNYASFDSAMAHSSMFALCAWVIYATQRFFEKPSPKWALAIGAAIGLAALSRPTDIIFALIPVLWGVASFAERVKMLLGEWKNVALAALAILAIGSIQLLYWKYVSGQWLVYSYGDQGFNWLGPHFHAQWFSYRKGWFLYTPMMALAIAGLVFLWLKHRTLFWGVLVVWLVHNWIVAAWNIWWYGGGFGQRAMIDIYPVLAFPLAALTEWVQMTKVRMAIFAMLTSLFIWLNVFQTAQAHGLGGFETENMTRAYYWRIFANARNSSQDRFLLDTDEGIGLSPKQARQVFFTDFENWPDTVATQAEGAHSGKRAAYAAPGREYSVTVEIDAKLLTSEWLRARAFFMTPNREGAEWRMTQFMVSFEQAGKPVKVRMIRPSRELWIGAWKEIGFDTRLPEESFDKVRIFLWNTGSEDKLLLDDLTVELFN
jgi:hypothetical protein